MPPMAISKALALKSATSPMNFFGSMEASFSRRLVCTQRMGSFIHQPSCAGSNLSELIQSKNTVARFMAVHLCPSEHILHGKLQNTRISRSQDGTEGTLTHVAHRVVQVHAIGGVEELEPQPVSY